MLAWINIAGFLVRQALSRWWKCRNGLAALVEGGKGTREWGDLSTEQQEAACAECLRLHGKEGLPRPKRLLLPVGRTLEDVDIYGIDETGKPVYAQVTFLDTERDAGASRSKISSPKKYGEDSTLVYFCRNPSSEEEEGVFFVDVEREVRWWIRGDDDHEKATFGA